MSLYLTKAKTSCKEWWENLQIACCYYKNEEFRKRDLSLLISSLMNNPYRLGNRYVETTGDESYTYGETPLTTMAEIVKRCDLKRGQTLFELGSGRSRAALFLATYFGLNVVAIENVEGLYQLCQSVLTKYPLDNFKLQKGDFFEADFSKADCLFLFGSCMKGSDIKRLIEKCQSLKKGAKVISVSFPLEGEQLKLIDQFELPFYFGEATIYIHQKKLNKI